MLILLSCLVLTPFAIQASPLGSRDSFEKTNSADVIVIGVGASGLTAASRLTEAGFEVLVLEAQNRIGGRIWSYRYENEFVELGAQAVWGDENFLINYARKYDLLAKPTHTLSLPLLDSGDRVNATMNALINSITADLQKMLRTLVSGSPLGPEERHLSLGAFLDRRFAEYQRNSPHPDLAKVVYDHFVRGLKTEDSADSLYDLSVQSYTLRKDKATRAMLRVPLSSVLQNISSNIPKGNILFNHKVDTIHHKVFSTDGRNVAVRTTNGRTFTARHVIVTTSLGVLKAEMDTMFKPPLSLRKREAIRLAGFGNLAKIALVFEEEFWEELAPMIANLPLFWMGDTDVDHERRYANKIWMRGMESFKFGGNISPNYTLIGYISGQRAAEMEQLPEETVMRQCMQLLANFTGLNVPRPKTLLRGNWHSNPNFRGSFSYISQEFSEFGFTNADLAAPDWFEYNQRIKQFIPLLLFAGEATHDKFFSHASGAMETGFREADRVISFYKTTNKA